ncbi:MAG: beta-N-acetylhexosaminidase [Clostridia bacterium]
MKKLRLIPMPNIMTIYEEKGIFRDAKKTAPHIVIDKATGYSDEEYLLTVDENGVTITASCDKGAFRGQTTYAQMKCICDDRMPYLEIHDKPAFAYRGFMIDCARHFLSVSDLKKMIEAASLFKFNKFHWHLCDDQGWRMEISGFPDLTAKGSVRTHSSFGMDHDDKPYSGYYTKADIKEIVEYCAERYIDVIPEIEIPGHSSAMINAYPYLSCRGSEVPVRTSAGIFKDILCAGKKEVYGFLYAVLDEMFLMFPGEYIHLGGDEAPKDRWKECPACQKMMKDKGCADEEALQCMMINEISGYLKKHGKKAITWNECLRGGGLDIDIMVQNWSEKNGECTEREKAGGKVIVSDFFHYYCDYPHGMTSLKKTYEYDPIPKELALKDRENVIGVEAPIWTEFIKDIQKMSEMCYPRFIAVAETGWTGYKNKDYRAFRENLGNVLPRLKDSGLSFTVRDDWDPVWYKAGIEIIKFVVHMYNKETLANRKDKT